MVAVGPKMKMGGEYRLRNIGLHHWRKLREELHIDPGWMIRRVNGFAKQLGDHVSDVNRRMTDEGLALPSCDVWQADSQLQLCAGKCSVQ